MSINIKDPQTDRLARELAQLTGESITVAARIAIEERLRRVRARSAAPAVRSDLDAVISRGRGRRVLDDRTADEILGYDGRGLPS